MKKRLRGPMSARKPRTVKQLDEKKLRALVENSIDVITIADSEARIVYISPSVKDLLGFEPEELTGKDGFEIIWPEDIEKAKRILKELVDQPKVSRQAVLRLKHKDGSWRWTESQVVNLLDDPDVGGVISSFRDITDRKLIEDALNEAQDRFFAFMDASDVVAFMKDGEEFRYIYANKVFENRFNLRQEQILGKDDFEIFPEKVARQLRENDKKIITAWQTVKLEEVVPTPDEVSRYWSVTKFPLKDSRGRIFVGGIAIDVTAQREAERKETQHVREMEALNRLMVERELKMVELKKEIAELKRRLGGQHP